MNHWRRILELGRGLPRLAMEPKWVRRGLAIYWLALAGATHYPKVELRSNIPGIEIDKLLHFACFGLLTLLLVESRLLGRARYWAGFALGLVVAAAYSGVDEWTQRWVYRTVTWEDVQANLVGVVGAGLAVLAVRLRRAGRPWYATAARAMLGLALPIVLALLFRTSWSPIQPISLVRKLHLEVKPDHLGHFVGAMVITWILAAALPRRGLHWTLNLLNRAAIIGFMWGIAPVVEYLQQFVGRKVEQGDIDAHQRGLLVAVVVWLVWDLGCWAMQPRAITGRVPAKVKEELSTSTTPGAAEAQAPQELDAAAGGAAVAPAEQVARRGTSFVGHAITVSGLTFLSRITGLGRDAYLASAFGLSSIADAFWFGFATPNLFRRLFGEGALTAAFIPIYTDLLHRDRELARRFMSLCLALTTVVLGALTLLGEGVLSGALASRDWSEDSTLAIRLTMIMLPYMPLVCLVALLGSVLQVHGRFAPAAGMPIFLNVVMIAGTWIAVRGVDGEDGMRRAVHVVAVFVLVAGLVQLISQSMILLKHQSLTGVFRGTGAHFAIFWRAFLPTFLALGVFQINTFMDQMIALGLSPKDGVQAKLHIWDNWLNYPIDAGGLAALNNAQRLYQFPLGVFGIAIATAIFPALAKAAAQAAGTDVNRKAFRDILQQGLRLTMFIGLPASVGLILVSLPLTRVLFERQAFTYDDSIRVTWIIVAYAPAIWAYSMTHVLTRGFYALKDTSTPMRLSVLMVAMNFLLNITLVWPLGAAGLALSTAICAIVQNQMMLWLTRRYIEHPVDRTVWLSWGRTALLSAAMAAVLGPILWWFDPRTLSQKALVLQLVTMVGLGAAVTVGGGWLLGAPELRWVLKRRR